MKKMFLALGVTLVFSISMASQASAKPIACWDLNENHLCDLETEDINKDGKCNPRDCDVEVEPPCPVPKTGKTLSYVEGDDGDLRIGVPWPDPRFTDNFDGTVRDNLTGLIWTKSANIYGTTDFGVALTSCSSCSEGEYTDWRLPNVRELQSLVDYGGDQYSMLPTGHPFTGFGVGGQWYYWSSTSHGVTSAFCISFENGWMMTMGGGMVWCVRGGN